MIALTGRCISAVFAVAGRRKQSEEEACNPRSRCQWPEKPLCALTTWEDCISCDFVGPIVCPTISVIRQRDNGALQIIALGSAQEKHTVRIVWFGPFH